MLRHFEHCHPSLSRVAVLGAASGFPAYWPTLPLLELYLFLLRLLFLLFLLFLFNARLP